MRSILATRAEGAPGRDKPVPYDDVVPRMAATRPRWNMHGDESAQASGRSCQANGSVPARIIVPTRL